MPDRPSVSVLLPARDAQATIQAALASVRAQTFTDFEVVVVDDGSRDRTSAIVREAASVDDRIRLIEGEGRGIVHALNHGLAACRAPLVARFDADDLMHRDRLARQVPILAERTELAGVGSKVRCFPRRTLRDGMLRYEAWQNAVLTAEAVRRERFIEAPLVHPSMTLRRAALERVDGWRDSPWAEDLDLWLRMLESGMELAKVPEVLLLWRDGSTRLTRTDPRYAPETFFRAKAHFLTRGPLRSRPAVIWGAGPIGKTLMKALDAEGARVVALVDIDPRKVGQRVHGRPVIAPEKLPFEPGAVLLGAVGAVGAREEIRAAAGQRGYVEGEDFFACA